MNELGRHGQVRRLLKRTFGHVPVDSSLSRTICVRRCDRFERSDALLLTLLRGDADTLPKAVFLGLPAPAFTSRGPA